MTLPVIRHEGNTATPFPVVESKKVNTSSLTSVLIPEGAEAGDLLIMQVFAYEKSGHFPEISMTDGLGHALERIGSLGRSEETGGQFTTALFFFKMTGSTQSCTVSTSEEAGTLYVFSFLVEKGTYNETEPIKSNNWVERTVGTSGESPSPALTGLSSAIEYKVVTIFGYASSPVKVLSPWVIGETGGALTHSTILSRSWTGITTTGEPAFLKASASKGNKYASMVIAIQPFRRETHTFSITQEQSPNIPTKEMFLTRALTQSISPSSQKSVSQSKIITQALSATMVKGMAQTYSVVQSSLLIAPIKQLGKIFSNTQGQAFTRSISVTKTLSVTQEQIPSRKSFFTKTLSVVQLVTPGISKEATRLLNFIQSQTISKNVTVDKEFSITQTLSTVVMRGLTRTFNIAQGQSFSLTKMVGKKLRPTQEQEVSLVKSLPKVLAIVQGLTPSISKTISKKFSALQGQVVSLTEEVKLLEHFKSIVLEVTQSQNVSVGKFTEKVVSIVQPISITGRKGITRSLSVIQNVTVFPTKLLKHPILQVVQEQNISLSSARTVIQHLTVNVFQTTTSRLSAATSRTIETIIQPQTVSVGKGYYITLNVVVETIGNLIKTVGTKLGLIEQPQKVGLSSGQARQLSSGKLIWVLDDDILDLDPATYVVYFEDGDAEAVDELGQYEAFISPGDPDRLSYRLIKPKEYGLGTTNDPMWQ